MLDRLRHGLRDAAHDAAAHTAALLHETTLRIAVTGLARAGKTVFVTSLVHNLLALGRELDTLPRLSARLAVGGVSRLRTVRALPPGTGDTPAFDHAAALAALAADAPAWPARTEDLSEIILELEIERSGLLARRLGPRRVRLEILDYPGEWLLDLPLLEQSFADWSRDTLARLWRPLRREACAAFLAQLPTVDPDAPPVHGALLRMHRLYRDGLLACRALHGLRLLQPGRFVCPGPGGEAPFMLFFPLPDAPAHPAPGSTAALLAGRFERYKQDMRARFFDAHFARFDRQVLLVDVLGALHGGREAFEDVAQSLSLVADGLRYGPRRFGMLSGASIERVAVVATKADHVPHLRRDNLRNLLRALTVGVRPPVEGERIRHHAAAAVLSTADATVERDGLLREVVRGVPLGEAAAKLFDPGDVPSAHPHDGYWSGRRFELPVFRPPRLDATGGTGIPHLGLDAVLAELIGDTL